MCTGEPVKGFATALPEFDGEPTIMSPRISWPRDNAKGKAREHTGCCNNAYSLMVHHERRRT